MVNSDHERTPQTGETEVTLRELEKGPVLMWEDTIVEAMGAHWRSSMVACRNRAEWHGLSNNVYDALIFKW